MGWMTTLRIASQGVSLRVIVPSLSGALSLRPGMTIWFTIDWEKAFVFPGESEARRSVGGVHAPGVCLHDVRCLSPRHDGGGKSEGRGVFSFHQYASLFDPANGANSEAILNSIFVAVLSVVFSGLLGLCLAFVVTQVEFPGKAVVARLAILPIALPPLVGVIAFRFVFGSSGLLPRILQGILHTANPVLALEGIPGVVIVHVYSFHVYTYLFCAAALRNIDGALIDAAAGLGAEGGAHSER